MKRVLDDLHIRRLNAEDAEAFAELRRVVTEHNAIPMGLTLEEELGRPLQGFRDQLSYSEPNAAFGAFLGNELVGSAAVAWPSKFPSSRHKTNLWGVFVLPSKRGGGIGREVVSTAIRHAFANGASRVNLQVFVPNPEAVSLYLSLGFAEYGREPEAIRIGEAYYDGLHMSLAQNEA
jgi:RimJ/RimL family protein N-acetyltransferase